MKNNDEVKRYFLRNVFPKDYFQIKIHFCFSLDSRFDYFEFSVPSLSLNFWFASFSSMLNRKVGTKANKKHF